jgi:fatty-acyl-CoA synthase
VTAPNSLTELLEELAGSATSLQFLDASEEWSGSELMRRSRRVAHQLKPYARHSGSYAALVTADRRRFVEAFLGCQLAGVTPIPFGTQGRWGSDAWSHFLRARIGSFPVNFVITDPAAAADIRHALPKHEVAVVCGDHGQEAEGSTPPSAAFVQPSSGTTGEPKGVVVAQHAALWNISAIVDAFELSPTDRGVTWLPFFHDMGLIGSLLAPLAAGMRIGVSSPESFLARPRRWLEQMEAVDATIAVAPPSALELVRRSARGRNLTVPATLRSLLVGAEEIRPNTLDDFEASFPHPQGRSYLAPVYGLAEAVLLVSATRPGERHEVLEIDGRQRVACGQPIPGVRVQISEQQELLVHTPSAMQGYLGDPPLERDGDGAWIHTGDIATLEDGQVVILGRAKEMINRGGARIAPHVFEEAAAAVPGVRGDRVAAVGVMADERETVVVVVESPLAGSDRDALTLKVRNELLDAGVPADVVWVTPPGFIPRTTSGKLRRDACRRAYEVRASQVLGAR